MLQYVTGGKWGLLLRRPLQAMTRTLPLVALMVVPILVPVADISTSGYSIPMRRPRATPAPTTWITHGAGADRKLQAADAQSHSPIVDSCIVFAVLMIFMLLLNKWSLDATPIRAGTSRLKRWPSVRKPQRARGF